MNKDKEVKKARAKYVQGVINKSKNTDKAVKKLSRELYLSERTIYNDLKK